MVPRTRGTYSGGFCYDYLSITALTMTLTFEYLQSTGTMATSVAAGSAARLAAILCAWADEKAVSAARMRDAVALVRWFAEHMLRLYGEQNAVSRQAQEVLTLLQKRGEACILERTLADTLRKRQGFDKDAFERALCELAARGYIQRDEVKGGGRPTKYIYLHPGLMQERSETL